MSDGVEPHSGMICGHMNSDHADAVAHLAMHHARLQALPAWTSMDAITRDHISISYKVGQDGPAQSIVIALEPPIETVMDSRKRLVDMSRRAEEENAAILHQHDPAIDSEVVFSSIHSISMNPVVIVGTVLLMLPVLLPWSPEYISRCIVWLGGDGITGWFSKWISRFLYLILSRSSERRGRVLVLLSPILLVQAISVCSWLSQRWRNAPPATNGVDVGWIWGMLTSPSLPPLDELGWRAQIVVITGGAQGLGAEIAMQLAQKGAKVVSLDVAKMKVSHENISSYVCDVSKFGNVEAVCKSIVRYHGPPTVLVNNCGVKNGASITDTAPDAIERAIGVNTLSHFWTIKAFLPAMLERGRGHIVTVSSVLGYANVANLTDYVASKHAVVGLHESLRFELDSIHKSPFVRTTLVCPGHMDDTQMFSEVRYNDIAKVLAPTTKSMTVAARVIEAIRRQESTTIHVPSYVAFAPALSLLPSFLLDLVQQVLGANTSLPSK